MARRFCIGFKINGNKNSINLLCRNLTASPFNQQSEVVIVCPLIYVGYLQTILPSEIELVVPWAGPVQNAQNNAIDAFSTGISADMLKDAGVKYAIIGHSDEMIADKVMQADLKVMICIGETWQQRESHPIETVLCQQMKSIADAVEDWSNVILIYEPIWATQMDENISPQQIQQMHRFVREWMEENVSETASAALRIMYGGLVTAANCKELFSQPDIDGFFVGDQSLNARCVQIILQSEFGITGQSIQCQSAATEVDFTINHINKNIPIRTVHITPIEFADYKITMFFEHFGEVESFRRFDSFGFVQFKLADVAETVILKSPFKIGELNVEVKAAYPWHQPDFIHMPPDQQSDSHILNVPDDCFRIIFNRMSLLELTNAANVCTRFQKLAQVAFDSKFKGIVKIRSYSEFANRPSAFEKMLRTFGASIHSIDISTMSVGMNDVDVLELIGKHTTLALKNLRLEGFNFHSQMKKIARLLFGRPESLIFDNEYNCKLNYTKINLLKYCNELKVLKILDVMALKFGYKFPKLEVAHFSNNMSFGRLRFQELNKFFTRNPTLKKLIIREVSVFEPIIFSLIGQKLPNLEELELQINMNDHFHPHILDLGRLSLLKAFKIKCICISSIAPLMETLAENHLPIECLNISLASITDETITHLSKLNRIETLTFKSVSDLTNDQIIELVKELPKLKVLSFIMDFLCAEDITFTDHDYGKLLQAVQNRREKVPLRIQINSYVIVSEEILSKNDELLKFCLCEM